MNRLFSINLIALVLCTIPLCSQAAESVDTQIQQIEQSLNSSHDASSTHYFGPIAYNTPGTGLYKLLPDISVISTIAGAYFTADPTGDVGHDPSRTGFNLQEIELAFQSYIDPYFHADIFLSFHEDGVELEEGYATTLGLVKGLQILAGKKLLPFGRQNPKHLEMWSFVDNMLVTKYLLGPEGLSELGVVVNYLFPTPFFLQLQGSFTNGDNQTSFGGTRKQDFLYQGRAVASVDLSDNTTLLMGGSTAFGFNDSGPGNQTNLYGGDLYLKWKPSAYHAVSWQSEYIYRKMDLPGVISHDGGLYSYVDVQFAKRWHTGIRYDQMGLPAGQVERETRVTPAITFDPSEFSRLRLQFEWDKVHTQSSEYTAFLQLEFSMGPHGAHQF